MKDYIGPKSCGMDALLYDKNEDSLDLYVLQVFKEE